MTTEEFNQQPHEWKWNKVWDDGECLLSKIVDGTYIVTLFEVEEIFALFAIDRATKEPIFSESYEVRPDEVVINGQPFNVKEHLFD